MRRVGLAGVVVAAALTAGCTGAPSAPTAGSSVGRSTVAVSTSSAASAPNLVVYQDIPGLTRAVTGRIAADRTAHVRTELSLAGNPSTGSGVIRLDGNSADYDVTTGLPSSPGAAAVNTRLVAAGPDVYANFARTPNGPAQWIRVTGSTPDLFVDLLEDLSTSLRRAADPGVFLALASAGGQLTAADRDTTDGQPTVRYAVHVDVTRAQASGPAGQVAAELLRNGVQQLDFQLWLGAQDRPARLASSQALPDFGPVTGSVSFDNWGQPVSIIAPPANQITTH